MSLLTPLEDVEMIILRKFQEAHKAGDTGELLRLTTGLEGLREAIKEWSKK